MSNIPGTVSTTLYSKLSPSAQPVAYTAGCQNSPYYNQSTMYQCHKDFWGNESSGQQLVGDVWYSTNYFADVARNIILRQPAAEPLYIHLNWSVAYFCP